MKRQVLFAAAGALICGCASADPCDSAELQRALDRASPGEVVEMGACRVTASLAIPAGVTLRGQGTTRTVIVAAGGVSAVTLQAGSASASLADVSVESTGGVAVRAAEGGSASLVDVEIRITGGIGFGGRALSSLRLERVRISGPVTAATATAVPPLAGPDTGASIGLVLIDAGSTAAPADLRDVVVEDVGPWGGILENTWVRWNGGGVHDVVGTGLLVQGGGGELTSLTFDRFFQGLQPTPAYALALTAGSALSTRDVQLIGSEGVGLLQDQSTSQHVDLRALGHRFGGLWVQRSGGFALSGAASLLQDNGLAGVVVVASSDVTLREARIEGTTTQLSVFGERGAVEAADGVQLLSPTGPILLSDLVLSANARVGVLVDVAAGALDPVTLTRVSVDGTAGALGAIAQGDGGLFPRGGWDDGVTRLGATDANDTMRVDPLGVVGAVVATSLPTPGADISAPLR